MATNLIVNGVSFAYPNTGDQQWGSAATAWAVAVTNGMLQLSGGSFPLTADANFGSSFGLISTYFKSRTANVAAAGAIRLANADLIAWRNAANNADLAVTVDATNNLKFNGNTFLTTTGALTASRAVATDGSSAIVTSSVTATELGYLSGVTSAVQTQLDAVRPATKGGTGVANNVANTLTFSGNFGLTLTLTGTTALTVPASGTVISTASSNNVSNSMLAQMATNTIKGNNTGGTANAADLTAAQVRTLIGVAPTVQKFTSSSGTYTTPTSPGPLYIHVKMVGGGGGGGGAGASGTAGNGGAGGNTTFGTTLLAANGGGATTLNGRAAGAGGTASLGSGPIGTALSGASGTDASLNNTTAGQALGGPPGASTPFGGGGGGGSTNGGGTNVNAPANTGAGGGAGGLTTSSSSSSAVGSSGSAGGYIDAIIASPSATYAYAVGASGTAGTAGTNGAAGGTGGSGYIVVTEYYQ